MWAMGPPKEVTPNFAALSRTAVGLGDPVACPTVAGSGSAQLRAEGTGRRDGAGTNSFDVLVGYIHLDVRNKTLLVNGAPLGCKPASKGDA